MRKIIVFICVAALSISMTACGNRNNGNNGNNGTNQSQSSENQNAQTEGNNAQNQGTQAGNNSQNQGNQTGDNSQNQGTQAGNNAQNQGTQAGNDSQNQNPQAQGWSEEMTAVRKAVTDALGEDYWPNTQLDPDMLEGSTGVTSDMYDDYLAEMPMISTNVDTLVIVKAKEGQTEAVKAALDAYRERLVEDTLQYPMNVSKIQASMVEVIGSYVCFVQLGADTMAAMEESDEAAIAHCQEQNKLALEAIRSTVE